MQNLWSISLQAILKETNTFRRYEIYGGKDLFGQWILTIAYGRIGRGAHIKTYFHNSEDELQHKLRYILQKRLSSKRRIGTNYQIIKHSFNISALLKQSLLKKEL